MVSLRILELVLGEGRKYFTNSNSLGKKKSMIKEKYKNICYL